MQLIEIRTIWSCINMRSIIARIAKTQQKTNNAYGIRQQRMFLFHSLSLLLFHKIQNSPMESPVSFKLFK